MKEFSPINQEQLTTQAHASKLGIRGDIFMSGEPGGGETPPIHQEAETPRGELTEPRPAIRHGQPVTPERQQEVREIWLKRREEQERGGERITREQIETEEKLIRMGIPPISGGSGDEPEDSQGHPVESDGGDGGQEPPNPPASSDNSPEEENGGQNERLNLERSRELLSRLDIDVDQLNEETIINLATALAFQMNSADQAGSTEQQQERGFGFYLQPEDMRILNDGKEGPLRWLEGQFDTIYKVAGEGQELSSPVVSNIQTVVSEAIRYLQYSRIENPEIITDFISAFSTRLNLIFMRSAIDHRSMDSAKEMSERLQTHGLFTALSMENGNVNRMFSRMAELLEDKRLAQERVMERLLQPNLPADERQKMEFEAKQFHVTPEMMSRLQDDLIEEQLSLAERGVGQYEDIFNTANTAIQAREGEIRRTFEAQGISPEQIGQKIKNLIKAEVRKNAEPQIRRSVRTAYDVLVVSQRQAVVVARGHRLPGDVENYMSDPAGLFNVYNYEDLLTEKFNIFNKPAGKFLIELKKAIAISKLQKLGIDPRPLSDDVLLDYGKRMFRDLFAVPDFFTSGWRIDGIQEMIGRRVAEENKIIDEKNENRGKDEKIPRIDEKDFSLFLQLKDARRTGSIDVWRKIAEIRPEEIARLYRERADGNAELTSQMERFFEGDVFDSLRVYKLDGTGQRVEKHDKNGKPIKDANGKPIYEFDAFLTYDKFKKEFGPLIQTLRQQGYDNFKVLRIGQDGFKEDQIKEIIRYFDGDEAVGRQKAGELKEMFKHFTDTATKACENIIIQERTIDGVKNKFIVVEDGKEKGVIYELMANDKFEDIYTRTLLVDDALLDQLEKPPAESGLIPLSRYWTSEIGGDALVRNYKDTENAAKAAGNLLKFIYTEDPKERIKAAEDFADLTSQYNGQAGRADALRYTVGSLLDMSKQDFIWDAIGISKLPFRQAMSKIEEIYGPQAKPMSRDELRVQLDNIHSMMVSNIDRVGKKPEKIKEEEIKAEAVYRELERLLQIDPKNMLKRRAASFLVYLIMAMLIEGVELGKSVAKAK